MVSMVSLCLGMCIYTSCMCACAAVLLCLCMLHVHLHIQVICSIYTCVITHMKRPYLSKTHAVQHCHAVLTFKQDTCILKQATTMLACCADTAMAKKGHSKLLKHGEHEIDISLPTGPSSHRSSCRLGNLL